ncbi:MAG: ATP-binding protein, partial [Chloroflexota bacterium]
VRLILCNEINNCYHAKSKVRELIGLLGLIAKHMDPIYHGLAKDKVQTVFVEEKYLDHLYEMLSEFSEMVRRPLMVSRSELRDRVPHLATTPDRTMLRYFDLAESMVAKVFGEYLEPLYSLVTAGDRSKPVPLAIPVEIAPSTMEQRNIKSLLLEYTLREWTEAPVAFGMRLPLEDCIHRQLRVHDEQHTIDAVYLANHLVGYCGTISGLPGSGRTTVALLAVHFGNLEDHHHCYVFYMSLVDYLQYARKGLDYTYYIAAQLSNSEDASLRSQIAELNRRRELVILCDDFDRLSTDHQSLVLCQLSTASSIFYISTPWLVKKIQRELREYREYKDADGIKALELMNLDASGRDRIASLSAKRLQISCSVDSVARLLEPLSQVGTTPLEVIAAIKSDATDDNARYLAYTKQLLTETLHRAGLADVWLPRRAEDLDLAVARYIALGRAVREVLADGSTTLVPESDDYWSTVWIPVDVLKTLLDGPIDDLLSSGLVRYDGGSRFRLINRWMETFLAALDWYYSGNYQCSPFQSLVLTILSTRLDEIRRMASSMSLVLEYKT